MDPIAQRHPPLATHLLRSLLWLPFWSIAFTLFFGALFAHTRAEWWLAYRISMVFGVVLTVANTLLDHAGPLYQFAGRLDPGRRWLGLAIPRIAVNLSGSYLAAFLVQRFLLHGFLGGPRAWIVNGLFALLFTLMIGGLISATVYYRESLERAATIERTRRELAQAELRALRAQVNPHFLFNTLNTIAALIAENPRAAEDVVTRLADVFRYALRSAERETSPLGDELAFLRAYLAVERARFGERLRLVENIEPGLEAIPVPSLLLQPLVENAVRYAVLPRAGGGTVGLEARRIGDTLELIVSDDGPGFRPEEPTAGHGVGLESVRERLRLAGAGHSLAIESSAARGSLIRVTLPVSRPPSLAARVRSSSDTTAHPVESAPTGGRT